MSAAIPTTVQSSAGGFQPAFAVASTGGDRHADAFAVVATLAGVSLVEVFKQAEALGMPKSGPYSHWVDGDLISSLLAAYGWAASEWKEVTTLTHLPTISICLVEYDEVSEVGRYVLAHSGAKCSHDAKLISYCMDPSAAATQSQIRTDLKVMKPAWYIGVQPMKASAVTPKK